MIGIILISLLLVEAECKVKWGKRHEKQNAYSDDYHNSKHTKMDCPGAQVVKSISWDIISHTLWADYMDKFEFECGDIDKTAGDAENTNIVLTQRRLKIPRVSRENHKHVCNNTFKGFVQDIDADTTSRYLEGFYPHCTSDEPYKIASNEWYRKLVECPEDEFICGFLVAPNDSEYMQIIDVGAKCCGGKFQCFGENSTWSFIKGLDVDNSATGINRFSLSGARGLTRTWSKSSTSGQRTNLHASLTPKLAVEGIGEVEGPSIGAEHEWSSSDTNGEGGQQTSSIEFSQVLEVRPGEHGMFFSYDTQCGPYTFVYDKIKTILFPSSTVCDARQEFILIKVGAGMLVKTVKTGSEFNTPDMNTLDEYDDIPYNRLLKNLKHKFLKREITLGCGPFSCYNFTLNTTQLGEEVGDKQSALFQGVGLCVVNTTTTNTNPPYYLNYTVYTNDIVVLDMELCAKPEEAWVELSSEDETNRILDAKAVSIVTYTYDVGLKWHGLGNNFKVPDDHPSLISKIKRLKRRFGKLGNTRSFQWANSFDINGLIIVRNTRTVVVPPSGTSIAYQVVGTCGSFKFQTSTLHYLTKHYNGSCAEGSFSNSTDCLPGPYLIEHYNETLPCSPMAEYKLVGSYTVDNIETEIPYTAGVRTDSSPTDNLESIRKIQDSKKR